MTEERAKRKMSAILSADVKGYSRLMGEDERLTVQMLKEHRQVIGTLVYEYHGRIVDSPGDNILSEFGSVVDAVECAVRIQEESKEKNANLPENRRMEFRIGVNLGDVIDDEGRIYGDGVNVAARVEGLADGGGICVSGTAYDQIGKKLPFGYEYLGEQTVKNIEKPVRVYRVRTDPEAAGKVIGEKRFLGRISRKTAMAAIIILVIVAGGLIGWNIYLHQSRKVEAASLERMAYPLPDKPSIAVLPFDNLSGDPDQEYFSDGLTGEIITGLSKVPSLFVIARNSSFIYKGKPVKVQQVSEELGVRYVLEGSVRKEGNRVRITAQLIDAISGHHMWSKRYDRKLENIFNLQDEIMRDILIEIRVHLTEGVQIRVWHKEYLDKKINVEAYEKQMQSRWHFFRMNPEGFAMSKQLSEEAIKLDPNYHAPYIMLAFINRRNLPLAEKYAQKALQLNDSSPMAHITMGQIYLRKRQWEKAIAKGERALELDPNGAEIHNHLGNFLNMSGRVEEAVPLLEKAIRLNPYPPSFYYSRLGLAYAGLERNDEAIDACKKALKRQPNDFWAHLFLANIYCKKERMEDARTEASEVLRINPRYSISVLARTWPYKDKEALKTVAECYRKAGIPE